MFRNAILRRPTSVIVLMILGLHCGSAGAADAQTLRAGDIATVLFPLVTFGIAHAKDDVESEKQWLRDLGVNEVLNTGLRVAFKGTSWGKRPDGSSYGFPSGHAGFVFSQAGFLQERHGWTYGVPALAMATPISYIRVREDKHHWRDVIAGGALGYGVAMITVTPIEATQIAPIIGPQANRRLS